MIKFDEQKQIDSVSGALALRKEIEPIVDKLYSEGINKICWLGIGGTWASCMQVQCHVKELSSLDSFVCNGAEYNATGDKKIDDKTAVVISSVTGTTSEIVEAVDNVHKTGAKIIGFIDEKDSPLAKKVDYCITYKGNEQLKFFMTADRFMYNANELPFYDKMYDQFDMYLPKALVEIEKETDEFALKYAKKHMDDKLHYFVGAGCIYGATYSYAMCYWEEMHWIRTKSIHAAELFHGMLEIIDIETPITLFVGEDSQRDIALRVANFLPKVNKNYTIIDSANYKLEGIDKEYRGYISHLAVHAVTNRIDAHIEHLSGHDMETRRYYRKIEY